MTDVLVPSTKIVGYHVTGSVEERAIRKVGFRLDERRGFGSMWGTGVYLALDESTRDFYVGIRRSNHKRYTKVLSAEAHVAKMLVVNFSGLCREEITQEVAALANAEGWSVKETWQQYVSCVTAGCRSNDTSTFQAFIQSLGYDSLLVNDSQDEDGWWWTGGNQLLVFNPENVKLSD